jgi:hypothetical protein
MGLRHFFCISYLPAMKYRSFGASSLPGFTGIISCLFLVFSACKTPVVEPESPAPAGTGTLARFPLDQAGSPGFSGEFLLEKLNDGAASGRLTLSGLQSGKRYFGKICLSSSSNPNLLQDYADLGEIQVSEPQKNTYLKNDYRNKSILFDSLLNLEGIIRILEVDPAGGFAKEVLRGDFGSNVILDGEKAIPVLSAGQSGISGTLKFRQRRNGNILFTGNISGLGNSDQLILNFFRGNQNATYQRIKPALGQISVESAGNFSMGFPEKLPDLNALDTLKGFIGFEIPGYQEDSLNLRAIANFGGNVETGNRRQYAIYSNADSTVIGTLELLEVGQSGSPLHLKFQTAPGYSAENQYFSLHRGTWLDPADTLLSVRIPASGKFELNQIPDGNGGLLRFNEIDAWNAHIRLALNDPLGESNIRALADLGANEILLTDSVKSYLSEINPSFNIGGFIIFRPRKNGQVFTFFQLESTQSGVENNLIIRNGPKPVAIYDTTASSCRVATFNGINPGLYKGFSKPLKTTGNPLTWTELQQAKTENSYLEYSFSDSGDFQVISRGNL